MKWCSQFTRLQVRTNADTPEQTANAVAFGATGIGLTRTEHMFFEGDRIDAMREMILADSVAMREDALAKLLPYQREDFFGIFKALERLPGHDPFSRSTTSRIPPELERVADGSRAEAQYSR
jgi:pyruvate,orthophosphate dikinase